MIGASASRIMAGFVMLVALRLLWIGTREPLQPIAPAVALIVVIGLGALMWKVSSGLRLALGLVMLSVILGSLQNQVSAPWWLPPMVLLCGGILLATAPRTQAASQNGKLRWVLIGAALITLAAILFLV